MLFEAFTSRSRTVPQCGHTHTRTFNGFRPSLTPHAEHTCEVGSYRPIFPKYRPYRVALYSSMFTNADHPAWSGSYFAGSVGGAPLSIVRQYIEQQNRPA